MHGVLHCVLEYKTVRYKYQSVWCESYSQVTAGIGMQTFFKHSGIAGIENTIKSMNWLSVLLCSVFGQAVQSRWLSSSLCSGQVCCLPHCVCYILLP